MAAQPETLAGRPRLGGIRCAIPSYRLELGLVIEQSSHILFRQRRTNASVAIEQAVGQRALSSLEFIHLLLDRTGGHQAVDKNRLVLADAMRAVDRLLFDRRI